MLRYKTLVIALVLTTFAALQGCALMAAATVGGVAGYMIKDEGYKVQSPVAREHQ